MKNYTVNPDSREPVRAAGWTTAVAAVLAVLGVRLAGLEPGLAMTLALGVAPGIVAEVGRRFVFAPATVARLLAVNPTGSSLTNESWPVPPRRDPGWFRKYWPIGLAVVGLAFAVPETAAILIDGEGGTLSEWTRDQLGTTEGQTTAGWWAVTAGLTVFTVWFSGHLVRFWPWERRREA